MSGTRWAGNSHTSYGHRAAAGTNAVQCSLRATIRVPAAISPSTRSSNRFRPVRPVYWAAWASMVAVRGVTNGKP